MELNLAILRLTLLGTAYMIQIWLQVLCRWVEEVELLNKDLQMEWFL